MSSSRLKHLHREPEKVRSNKTGGADDAKGRSLMSEAGDMMHLMNVRAGKPAVDVKNTGKVGKSFADAFQQRTTKMILAGFAAVCKLSS